MDLKIHKERKRQIDLLKVFITTLQDEQQKSDIHNLIRFLQKNNAAIILKSDLAKRYNWHMNTFNKRINETEGLKYELSERFKFTKWRKCLSPAEVDTIIKYLGEPPENS